jgi:hypothetical protein
MTLPQSGVVAYPFLDLGAVVMDQEEAWLLTKLVFWGILVFIILKLALALLLCRSSHRAEGRINSRGSNRRKVQWQVSGTPILGLNSPGSSHRGCAGGWVEETIDPVPCSRFLMLSRHPFAITTILTKTF